MPLKKIISLLLAALLAASCAPKKEMTRTEPPAEPGAGEEFRLPELPPEPEAAPAPEKKAPHLEAVLIEEEAEEKYILLNFENTDIRTIIATFSELLEINYILTPGVSGSVTIQSYKKFPTNNLFSIFLTILEINGLTAVKEGEFYKIVPIDTAKQQPLDIEKGKDARIRPDAGFITQLVPLEFVKANDIANILRNLMPRGTDIIIYEPANMLIVTSLPATLVKFMKIVEALDIPETETDITKTFVYFVENGEAKTLETILGSIYTGKGGAPARPATTVAPATPSARTRRTTPLVSPGAAGLPGEVGEVSVTAYEEINALIIKATPRDYLSILEVLKRIDVPPRQVLIEVMILEITLTNSLQYGLEWFITTGSGDIIGLTGVDVTGGFSALITGSHGDDTIESILGALSSETKLNMLASPHILARDNKEARIEIGDEIPIATGLTQQPSTSGESTTLVSSGQIQYRTVGTILSVKPRITEKNMVTLEITQEVSQLGSEVPIADQKFQGFSTRKAETTATVESGHTLILGGLIRETHNQTRSGVPFLSKIPLIGFLFSSYTRSMDKTELLLLVTPHVINNQSEADVLTSEFQNRVKTIKEQVEEIKRAKDLAKEKPEESAPVPADENTPPETEIAPAAL